MFSAAPNGFRLTPYLALVLLDDLTHPVRITRQTDAANSVTFAIQRHRTNQYFRCFIPATARVWNTLPSVVVESVDIQKFKLGANSFLINKNNVSNNNNNY